MPRSVAFIPLLGVLIASATACAKSESARASVGQVASTNATSTGASTSPVANASTVERTRTGAVASGVDQGAIVVNGQALSAETVRQLQLIYPVAIAPGRYWYDVVSGAWGREGQPIAGQMMAGLSLGGPLMANASRGTSGVFINGRQITTGEKAYIEGMCQTPVAPARYWIMSSGIGGFEGGPAFFNLAQCPGVAQQSSGPRSMSRTYCDANGACTSTGILGSILTTP
jgi:hypothetical protein